MRLGHGDEKQRRCPGALLLSLHDFSYLAVARILCPIARMWDSHCDVVVKDIQGSEAQVCTRGKASKLTSWRAVGGN